MNELFLELIIITIIIKAIRYNWLDTHCHRLSACGPTHNINVFVFNLS